MHAPEFSRAEDGMLCRRCAKRLRADWDALPALLDALNTRPGGGRAEGGSGKRPKLSGSPALARLDVIALLDPRTRHPSTAEAAEDGRPPAIDIPGEICGWAGELAEDHGLTSAHGTFAEAHALITAWWPAVLASSWVAEFYARVAECTALLWAAHRIERPRSVGHCLSVYDDGTGVMRSCDRPLYPDPSAPLGVAQARCSRCGRLYRGIDWLRVRVQAERMG